MKHRVTNLKKLILWRWNSSSPTLQCIFLELDFVNVPRTFSDNWRLCKWKRNSSSTNLAGALLLLDRIHRTTYVDEVYCYHPSSVVCWSVWDSIKPCKNGWADRELEMPFRLRTRVGPGNHVLDEVQIPMERGNFEGGKGASHCKVYRETLRSSVQKRLNQSRCRLGCGLGCEGTMY